MASSINVARLGALLELDLSEYRKGLKQAKTEGDQAAQSLGSQIKKALSDPANFGGSSRVAGFISDVKLGRSAITSLKGASIGLGSSVKTAFQSAPLTLFHAGLNGIKSLLGGLKGLAGDVFKGFSIGLGIGSVQAFGRVLSDLVNVIPDLVDKGRQYLRTVDDIADATGAGSVETSKFVATLMYLGVPLNGVINMIGQASRNLELMGPRLEALGIQVHNSNGAWLNQIQILFNAREAMSQWGAGSKKVDILAREFGRGGLKTLVDFLNLTDEQFKRITDDAAKMGLIVTEQQRNLGEAAIREGARFQNVLTGLGTALFTSVGPSIMAFFSNLTETIVANMDAIKQAVSSAIQFIIGAVSSILGMTSGLDSFSASIENANAVTSPYSSDIIDLTDQITKLGDTTTKSTDATDAQRKSIQKASDAVDRQIALLKKQGDAQEIVFTRAIKGLARVYQLRLDALDLAEKERDLLLQQRDLNDQLNQAQLDLMEAQKGKPGTSGMVVDAEAVSSAMAKVADIQRQMAENARQQTVDAQRKQLEDTKAYIESIGELLDKAENKRAALNTLQRRQAVLEKRLAEQQASGDTGGAADTTARLEAIKTAEAKAQQDIRNGNAQTELDRQKAMLQEELSNIRSVAADTTAIKRKALQDQLDALIAAEAQWALLSEAEKASVHGVSDAINGKTGGARRKGSPANSTSLVKAITEARLAGVKFGDDFKAALTGVGDLLGGIVELLGQIAEKGKDVPPLVAALVTLAKLGTGAGGLASLPFTVAGDTTQTGDVAGRAQANLKALRDRNTPSHVYNSETGETDAEAIKRLTKEIASGNFSNNGYAAGGLAGRRGVEFARLGERGSEWVADHALTERMMAFFSRPLIPQMQPALAGFGGVVEVHSHTYLDGREIAETVSRHQEDRRRR